MQNLNWGVSDLKSKEMRKLSIQSWEKENWPNKNIMKRKSDIVDIVTNSKGLREYQQVLTH